MMTGERRIFFKSFSSGSCGNCYALGVRSAGKVEGCVLIDAGVSRRRVLREMRSERLGPGDVSGILLTHDHWDHVRGLASFNKYDRLPVYATRELHAALSRRGCELGNLASVRRTLQPGERTAIVPGLIDAECFVVPHDATQTVGYAISVAGHEFVLITDCGRFTEDALRHAAAADTLVIESNYDEDMLAHGPYPPELQDRIRGGHGHASNAECAEALGRVWHEGLRNVFLCHLSEHNNTPDKAFRSAAGALEAAGLDASADDPSVFTRSGASVKLAPLPRESCSPMFTLETLL